jgi:hypothetical protein
VPLLVDKIKVNLDFHIFDVLDLDLLLGSPIKKLLDASLKDRLGHQRGGSEWAPIKILLQRENSAYTPNSQPRILTRVFQGNIVTTDLPTLGTNHRQSRSESKTQGAKDIATQHCNRRTIRKHLADCPHGLGGLSAGLRRTVRK